MVDATRRPLTIPQKYIDYLDRHRIHHLIERMYEELLINAPSDPLSFLVEYLTREEENPEVPKIFIHSSNQGEEMDIAMAISLKTKAVILSRHETIYEVTESRPDLKQQLQAADGSVTPELLSRLMSARTRQEDCVKLGWIVTGVPQSRAEAVQLRSDGLLAQHVVLLSDGPVERPSPARYRPPQGAHGERCRFARRLRHMLPECGPGARVFDTAGGAVDVRDAVLEFVCSRGRERAPLVVRLLLLGVPGCGRRTQAARVAAKHNLVNVHCGTLIRQAIKRRTPDGLAIEEFLQCGMSPPEELVASLVLARLASEDCRRRGWVLHGFPRNGFQAELLAESDQFPNRVVMLQVPAALCVDRLTSRRFEPASGQLLTLSDDLVLPKEVAARLRRHPDDEPRRLLAQLEASQAELRAVLGQLEQHVQTVDGTRPETEVAEVIEKITVYQTPKFLQ